MITGITHLHSTLRWVVLILLTVAFVKALMGWLGKKEFTEGDRKINLFALIATHLQLVIGFALYFLIGYHQNFSQMDIAMKDDRTRFFTVEHMGMMLLAIIFITIGYSTAKRSKDAIAKHKKVAIAFGIGLIVIFISIPWPFLKDWATWM